MISGSVVKFGVLSFLLIFFQIDSIAQYSLEGLDLGGDVYAWHDQALGMENTGLLLGAYQQVKRSAKNSHPFYGPDKWTLNSIRYNGEVFRDIYLLYDVQEDVLVFRHPTLLSYHSQPIRPIQNQVEWFTLDGHTFKYYDKQIMNLQPGFFDQLYTGDAFSLIVKRMKDSRADQSSIIYVPTDIFLVKYKDEYHRLKRRGSLLRVFEKEHRKEIREYIRVNNLKIKPDNEQDLQRVARFCDELLKESNP